MQRTIRHKLQQKTLLACEYDQLTENNAFNQILKATAEILLHAGNVKEERRQALKRVLLFFTTSIQLNRLALTGVPSPSTATTAAMKCC